MITFAGAKTGLSSFILKLLRVSPKTFPVYLSLSSISKVTPSKEPDANRQQIFLSPTRPLRIVHDVFKVFLLFFQATAISQERIAFLCEKEEELEYAKRVGKYRRKCRPLVPFPSGKNKLRHSYIVWADCDCSCL